VGFRGFASFLRCDGEGDIVGDGGGSGAEQAARAGTLPGVFARVGWGEAGAGTGSAGDQEGPCAGALWHGGGRAVGVQHPGADRRCRVHAHAAAQGAHPARELQQVMGAFF
jgi:hypothetical protein